MKENNKLDLDIQSFDIKEYLYKIISYWKLFVVMIFVALVIAKVVNYTSEKIYNLKTLITVKDEQNPLFSSSTNIAFNWGGPSDKVETIITILQSRSHNEKVVKKLNLTLDQFTEGRLRKVDVYGRSPIHVEIDTLKPQLINTDIELSFPNRDEVRIRFEMDDEKNTLLNYTTYKKRSFVPDIMEFDEVFPMNTMLETPYFTFSVSNLRELLDLEGRTYVIRFNNFDSVVKKFQKIDVSTLKKGTSIIELSFNGSNKKKIEDFLNTTVEVLDQDQRRQKIKYAVSTQKYIDTLFLIESNSLKDIETDLGDFKQQNNIYDLSAEGSALLNEITLLDQESQQIQRRVEYLNNLENYLISNSVINSDNIPAPALVNMEDPNIITSVNNLITLSKTREGLEKRVKPPILR